MMTKIRTFSVIFPNPSKQKMNSGAGRLTFGKYASGVGRANVWGFQRLRAILMMIEPVQWRVATSTTICSTCTRQQVDRAIPMDSGMPPPQSPREASTMPALPPAAAPPTPPTDPSMDLEPAQPVSTAARPPAAALASAAPELDKDEFIFEYRLQNWGATDAVKVRSPYEYFGGYQWRLLIFPRGNGSETDISIYLECGGPKEPPPPADAMEPADPTPAESAMEEENVTPRVECSDGGGGGGDEKTAAVTSPGVDDRATVDVELPAAPDVTPLRTPGGRGKETAPPPVIPTLWRRPTRFSLSLLTTDRTPAGVLPLVKETAHTFLEKEADWGFREFCKIHYIQREGFEDSAGSLRIRVRIRLEEVTADSMFNNGNWDSRKKTGYVGFKNQGATCYMNSLLQTLYMLGGFRRAVYSMPLPDPEDDSVGGSRMSYALQKVFYELQYSETTVKTKKLTESFGWESTEAFTQHDVQELNRILCDHLEERMKKIAPDQPNRISELFGGKILNYIECVNVDFKSTREESFFDLSLIVKGCRDLEESFDKYCEVETMDGDNKYRADGFDELQEARKGVRFLKLPPVLQLHLKRFEFDFNREVNVKINDRFEYPTEIDLSRYVEGAEEGTEVYVLHSVLVHIGDVNGGHYYAYIRPSANFLKSPEQKAAVKEEDAIMANPTPTSPTMASTWYKFDDDLVQIASEESAVQDNFGNGGERGMEDPLSTIGNNGDLNGTQTPPPSAFAQSRTRNYQARRLSNAYMLQYIRKDQAEELLVPPRDNDVPEELAKRIIAEQEEEERTKKARAEQHLYMSVSVATAKDLAEHYGVDIIAWDRVRTIRVKRAMLLREFKTMLMDQGLVGSWREMRLWNCARRENDSIRPEALLADGSDDEPIAEAVKDLSNLNSYHTGYPRYMTQHMDDQLKLFVEDLQSPWCFQRGAMYENAIQQHAKIMQSNMEDEEKREKASTVIPVNGFRLEPSEVLLFIKRYVPFPRPHLEFCGHMVIDRHVLVRDVIHILRNTVKHRCKYAPDETIPLDQNARLMIFEEFASDNVKPLSWGQSFRDQEIPCGTQNAGDILIFVDAEAVGEVQLEQAEQGIIGAEDAAFEGQVRGVLPFAIPGRYDLNLPLGGRLMPHPENYFRYLQDRCTVDFKEKYAADDGLHKAIGLELLLSDSYRLARKVLASAIGGTDVDHLRFFVHDFHRDGPTTDPVRCHDADEIRRILPTQGIITSTSENRLLWYERTEYALAEYEDKEEVRITWRPDGGTRATPTDLTSSQTAKPVVGKAVQDSTSDKNLEVASSEMTDVSSHNNGSDSSSAPPSPANGGGVMSFSVLVPMDSKYYDVMQAIRVKLGLEENVSIRLSDVSDCKISQFYDPGEKVSRPHSLAYGHLDHGGEVRAEPILENEAPESDEELNPNDLVDVCVAHVAKDAKQRARKLSYFGVPFVLRVHVDGESVADLRKRIRQRLDVPIDVFATWKLAQVTSLNPKLEYLENMEQLWKPDGKSTTGTESIALAIEHHGTIPLKKASAAALRFADAHKPLKIAG